MDVFIKRLEQDVLHNVQLCGVEGITKVYPHRTALYVHGREWVVKPTPKEYIYDTDGLNLLEVLSVEGVDHTRTTSNDITEILATLGIEAARRALMDDP